MGSKCTVPIIENVYKLGNTNRYVLVSDEHLGNIKENLSYARMVNKFAINNRIKGIIHGGDLFEGIFDKRQLKINTYERQLCHFLNDYPKSDYIKNYFIYGNHDMKFISWGYDLDRQISIRKDFVPIGKLSRYIEINNAIFFLKHTKDIFLKGENIPVTLKGHSHKYKNDIKNRAVYIPTLSDVNTKEKGELPGFLVLEVKGETAYITHYVITNEPHFDETIDYKIKTFGKMYK